MMTTVSNPAIGRSARWLAAIGVALLAVAAVSLAGARWDQFGPGTRLAILLAASAVVLGSTQVLRRNAPETTRALDVLIATLVPTDVAALTIVSGGTWRTALVASGPAAVIASEVLRRRDPTIIGELGIATGGVLTMAGLAASFEMSTPVLVAALGLLAVVAAPGGRRRSFGIIWATLAGLAPALRVLDEAVFTGMGTLRDLGLLDAAEAWEMAVAGLVATAALVYVANRDRAPIVALIAVATTVATGLQLWATYEPPATFGILALAIALGLVEIALAHPFFRSLESGYSKIVGDVNAVATGMLTLVVAARAWTHFVDGGPLSEHHQYTATVLAAVWLVGDLRRSIDLGQRGVSWWVVGGNWAPALPGLAVSLLAATYLATERAWVVALVMVAVGVASISTLRSGRFILAISAFTGAGVFTYDAPVPAIVVSAVTTLAVVHTAALLAQLRQDSTPESGEDQEFYYLIAMLGLVTVVTGVTAAGEWSIVYSGLFMLVTLWVAAFILDRTMPELGVVYRCVAQIGLLVVAHNDLRIAAAMSAAVTILNLLEHRRTGRELHRLLALVTVALTWLFTMGAAGVDLMEAYVLPPVWMAAFVAIRLGVNRWAALGPSVVVTLGVTIVGRIDDGRPAHLVILGCASLALAIWGAVSSDRLMLSAGGAMAVATAVYEGLAQSMGVETWGWLVVGGTAAVTAAGLLEARGSTPVLEGTSVS